MPVHVVLLVARGSFLCGLNSSVQCILLLRIKPSIHSGVIGELPHHIDGLQFHMPRSCRRTLQISRAKFFIR